MIKELYQYRKYIISNSWNELKSRYAGTVVGVFWNVLNPLFQILVYTFVFSSIMEVKMPGFTNKSAFAIYLCSGLLGWISFSEIINRGITSILDSATFLKKLPIPEHIFIAQVAVSSFFNGTISYILLLIILAISASFISIYWVLFLLILFLLMLFGLGLALILGSINVFLKDVAQLMSIFITVWMWLTPIVYIPTILPTSFRAFLNVNPIYPYIDSFHQIIVYHQNISLIRWGIMITLSFSSLLIGYIVLRLLRKEIRDYI